MIQSDLQSALDSISNLYKVGKFKKAAAITRKLIRSNPDAPMLHNMLGAILMGQGRYRNAVATYSKLIELEPDLAAGYMNLGLAHRELGAIDDAIKFFKKSIELESNFFDAYINLAVTFQENNELDKAIKIYQEVSCLKPNDPDIFYNLGTAQQLAQQTEDSINTYKRVLKIRPDYFNAHVNLGIALRALGDFDEALESYDDALKLDPDSYILWNNIAAALEAKGSIDEAASAYQSAIDIEPDQIEAYANLMQLYDLSNRTDELKRMMQAVPTEIVETKIFLYYSGVLLERDKEYEKAVKLFEQLDLFKGSEAWTQEFEAERLGRLAKLYDHLGQTHEAYEYFVRNNEFNQREAENLKYSKDRYLADIANRREYFKTADFTIQQSDKAITYRDQPVFLIGFPRSGTTLMDTILRSHPNIVVYEEKPALEAVLRKVTDKSFSWLGMLDESHRKELQAIYFDELYRFESPPKEGQLIIDKLPLNIIHIGEILSVFPAARFILALRNPADCVLSCFMQPFRVNDSMANFFTLGDSAKLYDAIFTLWEQYCDVLAFPSVILRYENLITNIEEEVTPVLEFLDLEWSDDLLSYSDTAQQRPRIKTPSYNQVIQPLYRDADGRWRRYAEKMSEILPILNPWMEKYGYSSEDKILT